MPIFLLFALMLFFMLSRVFLPYGVKATGKLSKAVTLSFMEKGLLQRVNVYSIGFVLLLMSITAVMAPVLELGVVIIALAILCMRVRCFLTSDGIGLNNVVFRQWREFQGFRLESRRIVLIGRDGARNFNLALLPAHQKELAPELRRHLPEVKGGKSVPRRRPSASGVS